MKDGIRLPNVIKWLLTAILFCLVILFFNKTWPIIATFTKWLTQLFMPFIIGFFFAFLLHPLVEHLSKRGLHRFVSVAFIFLLFLILLLYILTVLFPLLLNQMHEMSTQIPTLYDEIEGWITQFWRQLPFVPEEYRFDWLDIEQYAEKHLLSVQLRRMRLATLFNSFATIMITPIVTIYFLYDYKQIKERFRKFLIRANWRYVYKIIQSLETGISAYFRGMILIMNLLTVISSIVFMFIKLDYPILFGFLIGYTNIIPIFGPFIGGIPVVLYALTHSFKKALLVVGIIVVIQFIESNIITPYIQSKSIDTHPLLVLLAVYVFGKLFGLIGMIFAIPFLYVILLLFYYGRIHYRIKKSKQNRIEDITIIK